jgi:hypothetical protein
MVVPLGRVIFSLSIVLPFCLLWKCIISDFVSSNHTALFSAHLKAICAAASTDHTLFPFDLLRMTIATWSI